MYTVDFKFFKKNKNDRKNTYIFLTKKLSSSIESEILPEMVG